MVDRRYYRQVSPRRSEIVIATSPSNPTIYVLKRVIAVGGDTIEIRGDTVLINGHVINEPYVNVSGELPHELVRTEPLTLPPGKLFLMGDNRHVSLDSRYPQFGLVDLGAVRGKVIYPLDDAALEERMKRIDLER